MLKVNEEKLFADHKALAEKQEKGYAATEADALVFAQAHGYDEKKTADFVKYVQDIGKGGLTVKELHKLEVLSSYIEEAPDEEETGLEEVAETSVGNLRAVSATVNRV